MQQKVGVLGSAVVGQTLARGFRTHGYDVRIASRTPGKLAEFSAATGIPAAAFDVVAAWADLVVLAVRGTAAEDALRLAGAGNVAGKVVIDLPQPPLGPGTMAPAVYYVPPGGTPIRVAERIGRPNGLILSRDEQTLYVNDTAGIELHAFDVRPDGRLANRRVLATYVGRDRSVPAHEAPRSNADGLTIDDEGRLYGLTEAGIEVVSPAGDHLGVIPVWCITRRCQNLTFGGPDKRTLYVAGGGTLLRVPMLARGFAGRVK